MVLPEESALVRPLRIALIGSRGIPARYGGYETLIEELSTRLVQRGHPVTVYCRSHYTPTASTEFKGVTLRTLPTLRTKHLDTPIHSLLACLDAAQRPFDVALMVNSANALFLPLLRSAEIPVALHVDGIERHRTKWGMFGRGVYALSERLACILPDALVTDAECVRNYYRKTWQAESSVITYGVDPRFEPAGELMSRLRLSSKAFFLYVSRFEPENNPHRVVEAYARVDSDLPLVMVGGAPYAQDFIRQFTAGADDRVLFPGPIYGHGYRELLSHALAYIHATEVGGTHPALVEAMGYANCVIVNDTPENRETAAENGLYFQAAEPESLARHLQQIADGQIATSELGMACARTAKERFSWDSVVDQYIDLFQRIAQSRD